MSTTGNPAYNISSTGVHNYKDFLIKRYQLALAQEGTEEGAAHLRWMLQTIQETPLGYRANITQAKSDEIMEVRALVLKKLRAQPGYGMPGRLFDAREDRRVTDEAVAECSARRRDEEKARGHQVDERKA
ncbi:hypothetical protein CLAFUW4_09976 [Fulvia fulva]|uniref:Uncharacterized protein n=1 Tax=Passalora fulva TaxID=5499 RepID=A0A9Q8PGX6_PASFU|nr:uncharacterized protein CLAFUR5_12267 [Fulvia fulva]KAK4616097.1 hypothetical protein CLAFUR4_09980 [Fulvia fulva]KAK4616716.1 hypothetical protein CLAFUR0_09977 [Fulvia fulva]UJO22439.1 hypothetical protein CLAFUR5_12267 [Fulvia fulva]WPV19617.1 hypothetical protein CLAFUW4_09976 [Fulvia fulva]WPV34683.1 hypothetical protein CLAFUW7_09977 [Fulvia fulva]